MFVITRRKDEVVKISDNVFVKIISSKEGFVRLGIEAPRDILITPQKNHPIKLTDNHKARSGQN